MILRNFKRLPINRIARTATILTVMVAIPAIAADRQPKFDAVALRLQPDRAFFTMEEVAARGMHIGRGSVDFVRVTMSTMIRRAYGVAEYQLPSARWLEHCYTGRATFSPETPAEQVPTMLRAMLEERFGLRVRIESKVAKVWLLEQAPGGAKLLPASGKAINVPGLPSRVRPGEARRMGNSDPEREWLMMSTGTLQTFCNLLAKESKRPVIDRTGIKGDYDINVEVHNAYPRRIPPPSMTIPTEPIPNPPLVLGPALKKLGLKFRESKEPVDFLIIDVEPSLSPKS